jgi:hypothetical protein
MLRGLHRYPNIRHLVIHGEDPRAIGEALLALWQHGFDTDGRISGPRGRLSPELDEAAVDALRSYVQLWDWRGRSSAELAAGLQDLPALPTEREPHALPNPVIPERTVFTSRQTTYPMFSSDAGDSWLQLLNLAFAVGTEKQTPDGERIAEALNAVVTIETPELEDGEHEKKEDIFPTFLDFNQEDFDRLDPLAYQERLHDWNGIDQQQAVCDRFHESLDTRLGTMLFLEPSDDASEGIALDLISVTFNAVDRKLFGSFVLRSADLYTDWPLAAMALLRLQCQMAERLDLDVGSVTFIIHSAYLYERDWERSLQTLKENFKRPLPLHVDPSGLFLFGNDEGEARAMLLDHDASTIFWEGAFGDPEDLSWYIVDTMPWLHPQHIRYVGQECAALMRAMKEGEDYLQG